MCSSNSWADYRVSYVSFIHAGSTHASTAFQSTALHEILGKSERDRGLPNWATVAADDGYGNKGRILKPYEGHSLTSAQDSYNFYLSSCLMLVEQVFGTIANRFWHHVVADAKLGEESATHYYRLL
jgi:DDE superfamily endonuclease